MINKSAAVLSAVQRLQNNIDFIAVAKWLLSCTEAEWEAFLNASPETIFMSQGRVQALEDICKALLIKKTPN